MTPTRLLSIHSATSAVSVLGLTAAIVAMSLAATTPSSAMQRQLGLDGDSCVHHTNPDGTTTYGKEKDGECCIGDDCIIILKPFPTGAFMRSAKFH